MSFRNHRHSRRERMDGRYVSRSYRERSPLSCDTESTHTSRSRHHITNSDSAYLSRVSDESSREKIKQSSNQIIGTNKQRLITRVQSNSPIQHSCDRSLKKLELKSDIGQHMNYRSCSNLGRDQDMLPGLHPGTVPINLLRDSGEHSSLLFSSSSSSSNKTMIEGMTKDNPRTSTNRRILDLNQLSTSPLRHLYDETTKCRILSGSNSIPIGVPLYSRTLSCINPPGVSPKPSIFSPNHRSFSLHNKTGPHLNNSHTKFGVSADVSPTQNKLHRNTQQHNTIFCTNNDLPTPNRSSLPCSPTLFQQRLQQSPHWNISSCADDTAQYLCNNNDVISPLHEPHFLSDSVKRRRMLAMVARVPNLNTANDFNTVPNLQAERLLPPNLYSSTLCDLKNRGISDQGALQRLCSFRAERAIMRHRMLKTSSPSSFHCLVHSVPKNDTSSPLSAVCNNEDNIVVSIDDSTILPDVLEDGEIDPPVSKSSCVNSSLTQVLDNNLYPPITTASAVASAVRHTMSSIFGRVKRITQPSEPTISTFLDGTSDIDKISASSSSSSNKNVSHSPRQVSSTIISSPQYNSIAWTIDSVSLLPNVLEQLKSGGLLDDSVLEFFFRFLHRYSLPISQRSKIFFFNSYFYTKLMKGGDCSSSRHAAVCRWTNRLEAYHSFNLPSEFIPHDSNSHCKQSLLTGVQEMNGLSTLDKTTRLSHTDSPNIHLDDSYDSIKNQSILHNEPSSLNSSILTPQRIWEFDTVVIPLNNSGHHWTLALVCFPFLALQKIEETHKILSEKNLKTPVHHPSSTPLLLSDLSVSEQTVLPSLNSITSHRILSESDIVLSPDVKETETLLKNKSVNESDKTLRKNQPFMTQYSCPLLEEKKKNMSYDHPSSLSSSSFELPDIMTVESSSSDSDNEYPVSSSSGQLVVKNSQKKQRRLSSLNEQSSTPLESPIKQYRGIPGISKPAIFHLDSLIDGTGPPENLKDIIVEYFQEEFCARCPKHYSEGYRIAPSSEWLYVPNVPVPRQQNGFDCGVFLIEYLRHLFSEPDRIRTLLYECPLDNVQQNTKEDGLQMINPVPDHLCDSVDAPTRPMISNRGHRRQQSACSLWIQQYWFDQKTVTYRRNCLRQMLIYMQHHPHWKTTHKSHPLDIGNNSNHTEPIDGLQYLIDLFNSTKQNRKLLSPPSEDLSYSLLQHELSQTNKSQQFEDNSTVKNSIVDQSSQPESSESIVPPQLSKPSSLVLSETASVQEKLSITESTVNTNVACCMEEDSNPSTDQPETTACSDFIIPCETFNKPLLKRLNTQKVPTSMLDEDNNTTTKESHYESRSSQRSSRIVKDESPPSLLHLSDNNSKREIFKRSEKRFEKSSMRMKSDENKLYHSSEQINSKCYEIPHSSRLKDKTYYHEQSKTRESNIKQLKSSRYPYDYLKPKKKSDTTILSTINHVSKLNHMDNYSTHYKQKTVSNKSDYYTSSSSSNLSRSINYNEKKQSIKYHNLPYSRSKTNNSHSHSIQRSHYGLLSSERHSTRYRSPTSSPSKIMESSECIPSHLSRHSHSSPTDHKRSRLPNKTDERITKSSLVKLSFPSGDGLSEDDEMPSIVSWNLLPVKKKKK